MGLRPASGTGSCEVWPLALGDLYGRSPHPHHNYPHSNHLRSRQVAGACHSAAVRSVAEPTINRCSSEQRMFTSSLKRVPLRALWQAPLPACANTHNSLLTTATKSPLSPSCQLAGPIRGLFKHQAALDCGAVGKRPYISHSCNSCSHKQPRSIQQTFPIPVMTTHDKPLII